MFSTHVALVPYEEGLVPTDELLYVASALQIQVSRDLGPFWCLSGSVSPFLRLDEVPPFYLPVVIVKALPKPEHGFHIVASGRPVALVSYRRGWSLLASHELMEMLCDPWGNRTHQGRSLKHDQGHVEYLVEVCDPCQHKHYMIHDVHVSDFVTPEYYGHSGASGGRYSFTRSLDHPLQVPDGGILSWRTADGKIWQQSGEDELKSVDATTFSRASLSPDMRGHGGGGIDIADGLSAPYRTRKPYYRLERMTRRYGSGLRTSVQTILEQLRAISPKADPNDIVSLLEELADPSSPTREEFKANPEKTLKRFRLEPPANLKKLKLAPPETYQGVLAALRSGQGLGDPRLAEWLSTHGSFVPAGIW